MHVSCSIPCALNSSQTSVVFRDICRTINYQSPDRDIARETHHGLTTERWSELPEWVGSGEAYEADGEVKLHFDVESSVAPDNINAVTDGQAEDLSSLVRHLVQPFRARVFCIGWSKTGTTSLTEALRILGLFSWHFAPWVIGCKHFRIELSQIQADFTDIPEYTTVSDLPICALYRELDKAFPGSLFILTTRPLEAWIASAAAAIQNCINSIGCMDAVGRWAYGIETNVGGIKHDATTWGSK